MTVHERRYGKDISLQLEEMSVNTRQRYVLTFTIGGELDAKTAYLTPREVGKLRGQIDVWLLTSHTFGQ